MDELTHQKDDVEEEKERAEGAQQGQRLQGFRHRSLPPSLLARSLAVLAFLPLALSSSLAVDTTNGHKGTKLKKFSLRGQVNVNGWA